MLRIVIVRQPINSSEPLAMVLAGGGARTAYQVGVLDRIAEGFPDLAVPILTGVSAGAINAAFLANRAGSFRAAASELRTLWSELEIEQVLRVQPWSLSTNLLSWGARLFSGGTVSGRSSRGLVNTEPLRGLLERSLLHDGGVLRRVPLNVEAGTLSALAVTTTSYTTGQAVTFIDGQAGQGWARPYRVSEATRIRLEHILASAALPILFPAVQLGTAWHGDGGIRQTAPFSPAIHLGAQKIIAISTLRTPSARPTPMAFPDYPPPAQILGVLMNSIFLDNIDYDAVNLRRINRLLLASRSVGQSPGSRYVRLLVIRPTEDLGALAGKYESSLPKMFRHLTRGWGTQRTSSSDLLATLMFEAGYTQRLIQLGRDDVERRWEEIERFLLEPNPEGATEQD